MLFLVSCATPNRNLSSVVTLNLLNDKGTRTVSIDELEHKNKVSILWWNTLGGGQLTRIIKKNEGISPMDENLKMIASSEYSPDFIVLGEYIPSYFDQETVEVIKKYYPFEMYVPYSKAQHYEGIQIFSKHAFNVKINSIDWVPITSNEEEKAKYRNKWIQVHKSKAKSFERPYAEVTSTINGVDFTFVPVHLCNPWPMMRAHFEHAGTVKTALSLWKGTDNPLYYQTKRLHFKIKKNLIENNKQFLLFGDMNTPNEIEDFFIPNPFKNVSKQLNYLLKENHQHSFPAASAVKYKDIQNFVIDHAFTYPKTKSKANILPLRGSDHYPLYIIYEP